ncbi:ZIP family metal transporter [Halomonas sp. I5-271120]|uniref:ZIP family metal transporter n=1 Tax=Halomonas sp. I5-271120 TaxID=3061632 RepID=UPI002714A1FD|nr:divalent cation transporter [Halomonas sp. I5-271120]
MLDLLLLVAITLMAGLAMPLGAYLAQIEHIHPQWLEQELRHSVLAFGGGALLSAVALVLVPDGIAITSMPMAALYLLLGGMVFMVVDMAMVRWQLPASQFLAMLLDFIPESIVVGAIFAIRPEEAMLIAGLIALQNIPEAFNAYREFMQSGHFGASRVIMSFSLMALLGPLAGLSSYLWLGDDGGFVGAIMLVASGGILYSIFQDIAPGVRLEKHWAPPMGAVLGFVFGVVGLMVIG